MGQQGEIARMEGAIWKNPSLRRLDKHRKGGGRDKDDDGAEGHSYHPVIPLRRLSVDLYPGHKSPAPEVFTEESHAHNGNPGQARDQRECLKQQLHRISPALFRGAPGNFAMDLPRQRAAFSVAMPIG